MDMGKNPVNVIRISLSCFTFVYKTHCVMYKRYIPLWESIVALHLSLSTLVKVYWIEFVRNVWGIYRKEFTLWLSEISSLNRCKVAMIIIIWLDLNNPINELAKPEIICEFVRWLVGNVITNWRFEMIVGKRRVHWFSVEAS